MQIAVTQTSITIVSCQYPQRGAYHSFSTSTSPKALLRSVANPAPRTTFLLLVPLHQLRSTGSLACYIHTTMLAVAGARSGRFWSAFRRHSQSKHSIVRPTDPLDTSDVPVAWLDAPAAECAEFAGPSSDVHSASLRSRHSGEAISLDEKESGSDDWMPANASSLTAYDKISSDQALMRVRSSIDDTNLGLSMREVDILRQLQEKVQSYSRSIASLCHTPKRVLLNARYLTALISRLDVLQQQRLDQMTEVGVEETCPMQISANVFPARRRSCRTQVA